MLNGNHNHEMNSNDLDFNYAGYNLVHTQNKEDDNANNANQSNLIRYH